MTPFSGRWTPGYGPGRRVGFGNSNERGGDAEDEGDEDVSPEPIVVRERRVSDPVKDEAGSNDGDMSGRQPQVGEAGKPKRRQRKSAVRKPKEDGEAEGGLPTAKKRKGADS